MPPLYVSIRYVNVMLEAAEYLGASREALCARAGMKPRDTSSSDFRLPAEQYYRLWAAVMDELKDPGFPIRVAKRMNASNFDALGFAMMTSGNLGKTMQIIQRYLPFVTNAAQWEARADKTSTLFCPGMVGPWRAEHRFAEEFALAHIVLMARAFTGQELSPLEVCYSHPVPADIEAQQAFFGVPIRFNAPMTGIRMSTASLDTPFLKADPELLTYFETRLKKVGQSATPLATQVRRYLAECLPRQAHSVERISRTLGYSSRSLRRHLKEEGLTFAKLVDEVRRDLAKNLLAEPQLSPGEIAFALGYSEPSAFYRAFRRWMGTTPEGYRARIGSVD